MAEIPPIKVSIEQTINEALVLILNGMAKAHSVKITHITAEWVDLTTQADHPQHEYRVYRLQIHTESSHL